MTCRRDETITGMIVRMQSLLTRPEMMFIHIPRKESNNLFSFHHIITGDESYLLFSKTYLAILGFSGAIFPIVGIR